MTAIMVAMVGIADFDFDSGRILLLLVEVITKAQRCDSEAANDEVENVAIYWVRILSCFVLDAGLSCA